MSEVPSQKPMSNDLVQRVELKNWKNEVRLQPDLVFDFQQALSSDQLNCLSAF